MAKDKIHYTSDGTLVVNGKEYIMGRARSKFIDGIEHLDKTEARPFDRKDHNKKVKFIVEKIQKALDKKELIKELLDSKGQKELDNLYNLLQGKKKPKMQAQEGCLGLKIGSGKKKTGGAYLQLIE